MNWTNIKNDIKKTDSYSRGRHGAYTVALNLAEKRGQPQKPVVK